MPPITLNLAKKGYLLLKQSSNFLDKERKLYFVLKDQKLKYFKDVNSQNQIIGCLDFNLTSF